MENGKQSAANPKKPWTPYSDVARGFYRLTFDTGAYYRAWNMEGFFPEVQVVFEVRDPVQHHHVPLLLSPFSYSTYRGS